MSNKEPKRYKLLKNIDSPDGFCPKGTEGEYKNGVYSFKYTNNGSSFTVSENWAISFGSLANSFTKWLEEIPAEEILPESSKEFVWTDEKVKHIMAMYWNLPVADLSKYLDNAIGYYKNQVDPEPKYEWTKGERVRVYPPSTNERIEVSNFGRHNHCSTINVWQFATSEEIPKEKYPAIKEAIEKILNP